MGTHTRILSIDLYRGFALVFMALIHFGLYYGNEDVTHNVVIFFFSHGLSDWGAAARPERVLLVGTVQERDCG